MRRQRLPLNEIVFHNRSPGSWVVGPYLYHDASRAQGEYWYLGGTSMATPHVSGIVALMLQKDLLDGDQDLLIGWTSGETDIEDYLQDNALTISAGVAEIWTPSGSQETVSWGSDATGYGLVQADDVLGASP